MYCNCINSDRSATGDGIVQRQQLRACLDFPPAPNQKSAIVGGIADEEMNILLAAAEKIKKGVYIEVSGNPEAQAETVIEFLEGV